MTKRAIKFEGFTPVPAPYEQGVFFPDEQSAEELCKAINRLSSGWTVEKVVLGGTTFWRIVWLGPQ